MWYGRFHNDKNDFFEKKIQWYKKHYLMSGNSNKFADVLSISRSHVINDENIDSLVNFCMGRYYNDLQSYFIAWKYLINSKEERAVEILNERFVNFGFTKCFKVSITLLCISKHSLTTIFPKDIWVLLSKYVWKTNYDEKWGISVF
jgi:hypothetical protein